MRPSDNQPIILNFLRDNRGEHDRATIEAKTKLPKNSVISSLRALRNAGKVTVRAASDKPKAPLFYSHKA